MAKITAIEVQKRRPSRRTIYIDGQYVAGVDQEVVHEVGLKVGQEVDAEKLAETLSAEEVRSAKESALILLDYRARTRRELERRLHQKGYTEDVIAKVLDKLENIDLIDDERFAANWVASQLSHRPMGRSRMIWELRKKGVAPEIADEALDQVDKEQEFELALNLAERKLGDAALENPETKRKLTGFLRRRGFSWEAISGVLNKLAMKIEN